MSQIRVPAQRPYIGQHRLPEQPQTRAKTLEELEGTTRDLHGPAGASVSAAAVWRVARP